MPGGEIDFRTARDAVVAKEFVGDRPLRSPIPAQPLDRLGLSAIVNSHAERENKKIQENDA